MRNGYKLSMLALAGSGQLFGAVIVRSLLDLKSEISAGTSHQASAIPSTQLS